MGLKCFDINLKDIHSDKFLRNDEKYYSFIKSCNWNIFKIKNKQLIPLKEILYEDYKYCKYEIDKEYKGIPTGQSYIDENGFISSYDVVNSEEHPDRLKYEVDKDNILISSLRLAKSPALMFEDIEDLSDYVFSNGFYIFKVNDNWNKKFILYILRNKILKSVLDNNIYRGIGIAAYKDTDLLKIKIPVISKEKQNKIVSKIEPIEKEIITLKSKRISSFQIINDVFSKEFNLIPEKLDELKKNKNLYINLNSFSRDKDLRFSFKFNSKSSIFTYQSLLNLTSKKIKDFIS